MKATGCKISAVAVLLTILLACSGLCFAATVQGVVTASGGGSISGATVKCQNIESNDTTTVKTQSDGSYSLTVSAGTYVVSAFDNVHYSKTYRNVTIAGGATVTKSFDLVAVGSSTGSFSDDFSGDLSQFDTTTAINGQSAYVSGGVFYQDGMPAMGDGLVAVNGFQPMDFELTADISCSGLTSGFFGFCYREKAVKNPGYGNGGYGFFVNPDGTVRIFSHGTNWGNPADFDWSVPHNVKIRVTGNRHQVWVDGAKLIDIIDWAAGANNASGYIYTYVQDTSMTMDNLSIVKYNPPTGTVTGTVTKLGSPSVKIENAAVSVGGFDALTNASGVYSVSVPATEIYAVTAIAPQYLSATVDGVQVAPSGSATVNLALEKPTIYSNPPAAADTFTRFTLDKTEIGNYNWIGSGGDVDIVSDMAHIGFGGGRLAIGPKDDGTLFLPKDFDLTFTLQYNRDILAGEQFSVCWRQGAYGGGVENGGYRIVVGADGGTITGINRPTGVGYVWTGGVPTDGNTHTYRILSIGNTHRIWVDGGLVSEYVDIARSAVNIGGFIYINSGVELWVDDLTCYDLTTSTGVLTGVVKSGSIPLSGATVKLNGALSCTTGADGVYRFVRLPSGNYDVSASLVGYYSRTLMKVPLTDGSTVTRDIPLSSAVPSVVDTFSHATLDATEDASHWSWIKGQGDQQILDGQLVMPTGGTLTIGSNTGGTTLQPADFDLTITLAAVTTYGSVGYRQGYGFWMLRPENGACIYHPSIGRIANVSMGSTFNWNIPHVIRLMVSGARHQVWVDGTQIIDVTNALYATGGSISIFDASADQTVWDNLSITLPGDATVSGTVTELDNPSKKIAGAAVKIGMYSTTTDANGNYSVSTSADGSVSYEVSASAARYYESERLSVTPAPGDAISGVDLELKALPIKSGADLDALDTFTRANSSAPGVTEDANHWGWFTKPDDAAAITGEALFMASGGNAGPFKTASDDSVFQPGNFEASMIISGNTAGDPVGLCYRQRNFNSGYENGGYAAVIKDGHKWFYYSTRSLSNPWVYDRHSLDLGPISVDWNQSHMLRVRAIGKSHQAWLDGDVIVSWYDPSLITATDYGYIYAAQSNASTSLKWDNLNVGNNALITGPGTVTGTVYEAGNPSAKVAGATVTVSGQTVTTNSAGFYSVIVDATGSACAAQAIHMDYLPGTQSVVPIVGGTVTADIALSLVHPRAAAADVLDTFSRVDSTNAGLTEDTNHWSWFQGAGFAAPSISGGTLYLSGGGNVGPWKKADNTEFKPADFDASVDILNMDGVNFAFGFREGGYNNSGYDNGGYLVFIFNNGGISLFRGMAGEWEHVWQPAIPAPNWAVVHRLKVRAFGNHHEAWLDGQKIVDYTDTHPSAVNTGGYLYFTSSGGANRFKLDNFVVAQNMLLPAVITIPVGSTAEAKTKMDGANIDLSNVEVTKAFTGFFYVEDANRASGIRVDSSTAVSAGAKVHVIGAMATEGNERKIVASSVTPTAGQPTIVPLGMTNENISPNLGVNTVGLLVRVWGKVKSSGSGVITIDDGAGRDLKLSLDFNLTGYSYPDDTKYVTVTGVHGASSDNVIHVNVANDIKAQSVAP